MSDLRSRLALLGALLLLSACSGEEPPPPRAQFDAPAAGVSAPATALEIPADAPTVLFLGDSIGAGLHLAEHQAVPAVLQRRLAERGLPFHLVNASESGRTSAGGLAALDWTLQREPDLVIVELGGNDGLRGVDPATTVENLREIVQRSRAAGARVLLLGVRLPTNYGEFAERFDALFPALAEELDVAYVPYWMEGVGAVPEMNLPDGLHPTAEGHERLADNVEQALRDLLREAPVSAR